MRILQTVTTLAILGAAVGGGAALAASPSASPSSAVGGASTDGATTNDTGPAHLGLGWVLRLSAQDRACLDKADLRRPVGPLSDAQRAEVKAEVVTAATACGIDIPDGTRAKKVKEFWDGLTDAQRDCLRKADVTRPLGPLSDSERTLLRTDLREAAKTCGVTRPERLSN